MDNTRRSIKSYDVAHLVFNSSHPKKGCRRERIIRQAPDEDLRALQRGCWELWLDIKSEQDRRSDV
jgi:hypothetical protein